MLKAVLIANRGEIACRVIRTARAMGMRTIAIYSDADRGGLHMTQADEAVYIGPSSVRESYLSAERILDAARSVGADCIHPGYGFLSENAEFAEACADAGIVFVGPSPAAIRAMGLKDEAKSLMQRAGVPVVPGYQGANQEPAFLAEQAADVGYPVLIKAVAGGGGKGMRRVDSSSAFAEALDGAKREARAFFGNDRVLIEKHVASPRHIEVQVFGDTHGNAVHLFERDCSLQRRRQKVIEEAPAPGMSARMREAMGRAAVEAAKAVSYAGAGTVEFIVEGGAKLSGNFWFMEMNTRLQVEHPVTEMITGIDLVEWQFRIASGQALPLTQKDIKAHGHAVEARLYAEDSENDFLPSTGKLWALRLPEGQGIRVDAGVEEGNNVTPFYDPMIAKIVAHGASRAQALARLAAALGETVVAGPRCNVAFLKALCEAPAFCAGKVDTDFIGRNLDTLGARKPARDGAAIAFGAAVEIAAKRNRLIDDALSHGHGALAADPWDDLDGFQVAGARKIIEQFIVDDEVVSASIEWCDGNPVATFGNARSDITWRPPFWRSRDSQMTAIEACDCTLVLHNGRQTRVQLRELARDAFAEAGDNGNVVRSPMHGKLVALAVKQGDVVRRGQRVAVVEAMKMEHALTAPVAGRVAHVAAQVGAQVAQGAAIVTIERETGDRV